MKINWNSDSIWLKVMLVVIILAIFAIVWIYPNSCFATIALEGSFKTIVAALPDSIAIDTKTGSNRLLVVTVSIENSNAGYGLSDVIIGPRAGGVSLVQSGADHTNNVSYVEIWYATESQIAAMTADSLFFTRTGTAGSSSWVIGISMWSGVDQTELVTDSARDSRSSGTGTLIDSMLTDVAVNDLLIGVLQAGNFISHDWTTINSWTEAYDGIGVSMTGSAAYFIAPATQDSVVVVPSAASRSVMIAMCFRAAAAGGFQSSRRRKVLLGGK